MSMMIGFKLGMTRIFDPSGRSIAVTLVSAEPCQVVKQKSKEKDGYTAIQIGIGEISAKGPQANTPRHLKEFRFDSNDSVADELKVGSEVAVSHFKVGDVLKVEGRSKGKGFAGVIKRHNFHRGPESHGHDHHRAPGSIGSMFPQHVRKGKRMPGKMGSKMITTRGLTVVDVIPEQNLLALKGAVPGIRGSIVYLSSISK